MAVFYKQTRVLNSEFIRYITNKMENYPRTIFMGDANINLLKNDNAATSYLNGCTENGFSIMNKIEDKHATRIADLENGTTTKSIIDHDITKFKYQLSLFDTGITDHRMILLSINNKQNKKSNHINITKKIIITHLDNTRITNKLNEMKNWEDITFDNFIDTLKGIKRESIKSRKL